MDNFGLLFKIKENTFNFENFDTIKGLIFKG